MYSRFSKAFNGTLDRTKSGFTTSKALTAVDYIRNGVQKLKERILSFASNRRSHNRRRNIK